MRDEQADRLMDIFKGCDNVNRHYMNEYTLVEYNERAYYGVLVSENRVYLTWENEVPFFVTDPVEIGKIKKALPPSICQQNE